jgi:DNA-binding MarR family transcriptional regulator/ribosomal protein L40E
MVDTKIPILAQKHVATILLFLLVHKTVKKTDLVSIIHSNNSVDKLINELNTEGFISVKKEFVGRNTYYISLTDTGRSVAEKLKQAQDAAEGKQTEETQVASHAPVAQEEKAEKLDLELTDEEVDKIKHLYLLYHVNVMDDHVTVEEILPGKPSRIFNIYIKQNGGGNFRLWCEYDDSYDCWHVKAAWTYPQVQKMMTQYKGKVKVCPVCGFENPERAKFCMECGAKLE